MSSLSTSGKGVTEGLGKLSTTLARKGGRQRNFNFIGDMLVTGQGMGRAKR